MWLGYLEILKICDKYKQKSILNLKDNKLHASSIAILAAFIKGNNIKRDQFICESNDVAKYLDTIGFIKRFGMKLQVIEELMTVLLIHL